MQPFYMPALWPLGSVIKTVSEPEAAQPVKNEAFPFLDIPGNLTSMVASLRNFLLALLCVYSLPAAYGAQYPAFGDARDLQWSWMWPLLTRNILATWIICGFWDWFLYFSPYKNKLHKYKMNHKYPSWRQFKHDAFFTTLTSCWATVIEILLCHWWASGVLSWQQHLGETPLRNMLVALMLTHIRIPHFHITHRLMHPWKTKHIPDVGKFLYKHVHSLHHKSYNPTAFRTSMHPVEGAIYYSAALIPVYFGLHPTFAVATIIDLALGAWLGHDGFQWPGSGDYFHLLHHQHFDGNYGVMHVPLDWLFGTFIKQKGDLKKVWVGQHSGEEANETKVHPGDNENKKNE